ncbi:MAG TPA: type II secretion system protein [Firmicutes bacterium]|nr:type II secretion system protein [Bacillota bacterium]
MKSSVFCRSSEAGYTLMELLVVISVLGIVGGIILLVVSSGAFVPRRVSSWYEAEQNLSAVLMELSYGFTYDEVRYLGLVQASEATPLGAGTGLAYKDLAGREIVYLFREDTLYRQVEGGKEVSVLSGLTSVSFQITDGSLLEITLELAAVGAGSKPRRVIHFVALRNAQRR